MKKLIPVLQKISGYISIVVFGIMAVYALGMATPAACCKKYQDTFTWYKAIMPYNNAILILSIFGILIAAFYFILRNDKRIVYYISNYVWNGLNIVYTLVAGIITFMGVSFYQGKYNALPATEMNEYFVSHTIDATLNVNTPVFALGYILGVLIILSLIPHVLILVDKIKLSIRYEKNRKLGVPNTVTYDPKEAE